MYLSFIVPIIVLFAAFVYNLREWGDFGEACFVGAASSLITFVGLLMVCDLVIGVIISTPENRVILTETRKELVALKDNFAVEGRTGFLGSGYIDEELQYTYMYKDERGIAVDSIPAENSFVNFIGEDEEPYVRAVSYGFKNNWLYVIGFPMYDTEYYIYIPEGTIITNYYNIDLQ